MSSMLEQAIVDANALREAAVKTAESNLVEKYSDQIKEAVETLLEQAPPGGDPLAALMGGGGPPMGGPPMGGPPMGGPPMAPPGGGQVDEVVDALPEAALEEERACPCPDKDDEVEISIDLEKLIGALDGDEEAADEAVQLNAPTMEVDPAAGAPAPEGASPEMPGMTPPPEGEEEEPKPMAEGIDISEEYLMDILEGLKVDLSVEKGGWGNNGYPDALRQDAVEKALAIAEDDDHKEELEELRKAMEKLQESNHNYKEKLNSYQENLKQHKQVVEKTKDVAYLLRDKLNEANLTNAHLLYTNKVLLNNSLNGRQKTKIVEAIQRTNSVEETRTIYETLQSAVGSTVKSTKKQPESLSEAISRPSTTLPRRKEEKKTPSPHSDRWKILAGIE